MRALDGPDNDPRRPYAVDVQWWDGQTETFEVLGMTIGKERLELELTDRSGRCIPLRNVRWYDYGRRVPGQEMLGAGP